MSTIKFAGGLVIAAVIGAALMYLTAHVYPIIAPTTTVTKVFMKVGSAVLLFSEIILPLFALGVSVRYYILLADGIHDTRQVLVLILTYWSAILGVFLLVAWLFETLVNAGAINIKRYGEFETMAAGWILSIFSAYGIAYLAKIYFHSKSLEY